MIRELQPLSKADTRIQVPPSVFEIAIESKAGVLQPALCFCPYFLRFNAARIALYLSISFSFR